MIDLSFSECRGGYAYSRFDELHSTIEHAFTKRLQLTNTSLSKWEDNRLQELWECVTEEYERTKKVSIDGYILLLLLIELLKSAGSEEYMGPIDDEGGPGSRQRLNSSTQRIRNQFSTLRYQT